MVKKIMIVDDEKDLREMINALIQTEGFDTMMASNGKEALKILKETEQKPDLVLVDMFMPEMSGRELCEKIRDEENLKGLKLAFLTVAAFSNQGKQVLRDLDVLDYIVKPFDVDDFLRRVHRILEK